MADGIHGAVHIRIVANAGLRIINTMRFRPCAGNANFCLPAGGSARKTASAGHRMVNMA